MRTTEEIYFKEDFIEDFEINLLEPECIIITDNVNDDAYMFLDVDKKSTPNDQVTNNQSEIQSNLNKVNSKDCQLNDDCGHNILDITKTLFPMYQENTNSLISNLDWENENMHSVFMPEKNHKPKEIFTKCHSCGKYVIIRMSSETGTYTKCKYCYNNPRSDSDLSYIFEATLNSLPMSNDSRENNLKKQSKSSAEINHVNSNSKPEASFKCNHCGKWFTRNWYLKQHIKLHLNEKPFSCMYCDKRFLNSSNLKQHMKTHSFEYRCSYCNESFASASILNEHSLKHAAHKGTSNINSKILQCYFCKLQCSNSINFKEHLLTHSSELIISKARNSV